MIFSVLLLIAGLVACRLVRRPGIVRFLSIATFIYGAVLCVFFALSLWFVLPINNKLYVDYTSMDSFYSIAANIGVPLGAVAAIVLVYWLTIRRLRQQRLGAASNGQDNVSARG